MPNPRVASCIFCDDIRHEVGNKFSLIGIYGADLNVPLSKQIVTIPRFGIAVQLISDIDDSPDNFTVTILIPPDRQELMKQEVKIQHMEEPGDSTKAYCRVLISLPPFNISEEGPIEVMVDTGRETMRAGRLFVKFQPPETEVGT
jgi:hypothetical protein